MGASNSKLFSLGTVSAVALASFVWYYIFHGFSPKSNKDLKRTRVTGIVGLKNFGNTCYFNACVQALAACNLFCSWVERRNSLNANLQKKDSVAQTMDANGNDLKDPNKYLPFPVIAAFHQAFTLINTQAGTKEPCLSELIPSNLIRELTKHNNKAVEARRMGKFILNSHQEQDTHEAFNFILDSISDESANIHKVYHSKSTIALAQDYEDEEEVDESLSPSENRSFCNVRKSVSNESDKEGGDTFSCDELEDGEEELVPRSSTSSFCKVGRSVMLSSEKLQLEMSNAAGRISSGGGDFLRNLIPIKGKKSARDWFGGSIVSRTNILESEIIRDTMMNQCLTFDGTMGVKLVCLACCTQNPTILDKFNTLTVSLPRDEYRISYTLEDLMLQSLKPIQVHDVNCDGCFKKFNKAMMSSFVKYTAIGRLPLSLCVHVSRTEWSNDGSCIKRLEHVRFPLILELAKFKRISDLINQSVPVPSVPSQQSLPSYGEISNSVAFHEKSNDNTKYVLKAVICHSGGSADSGHFVTYRQATDSTSVADQWYFVSDCQTTPVNVSHVLASPAYMLFYEKKTPIINP